MSEIGSTAGSVALRPVRIALPAAPLSKPLYETLGVVLLCPILLCVAIWNGFPIIFYDTGAYMLQGLGGMFLAERSPIYSQFLSLTGGATSLWLVALAQCAITAFVLTQFARGVRPMLSLWALLALGTLVCVATGLPWYAGQIEPDVFVGVVPLAVYLLAFKSKELGPLRLALLFAASVIAAACHSAHIALAGGLCIVIIAMRFAPKRFVEGLGLPRPHAALSVLSVVVAVATVFAANYAYTKEVFFSRSGMIFLEARMMEDALIEPVLDSDCKRVHYTVCRYKDRLPHHADTWLWMEDRSPFKFLGGFEHYGPEATALVRESLKRYPLEHFIVAVQNATLQFIWFQTGDGIVPQEWVLSHEFKLAIPQQVDAYDHAYQQNGGINFFGVNIVHVPLAFLAIAAMLLLLRQAARRRDWRAGMLPTLVLLALIGNAVICGVFSGPHGRYQSRIVWLPVFVLALMVWPRGEGENAEEIGTNRITG